MTKYNSSVFVKMLSLILISLEWRMGLSGTHYFKFQVEQNGVYVCTCTHTYTDPSTNQTVTVYWGDNFDIGQTRTKEVPANAINPKLKCKAVAGETIFDLSWSVMNNHHCYSVGGTTYGTYYSTYTCPFTQPPTLGPTPSPTLNPTLHPTSKPTLNPTLKPTSNPTLKPTSKPTFIPTSKPTFSPSKSPTFAPINYTTDISTTEIYSTTNGKALSTAKKNKMTVGPSVLIPVLITGILLCFACIVCGWMYRKGMIRVQMENLKRQIEGKNDGVEEPKEEINAVQRVKSDSMKEGYVTGSTELVESDTVHTNNGDPRSTAPEAQGEPPVVLVEQKAARSNTQANEESGSDDMYMRENGDHVSAQEGPATLENDDANAKALKMIVGDDIANTQQKNSIHSDLYRKPSQPTPNPNVNPNRGSEAVSVVFDPISENASVTDNETLTDFA